jgi:hypothetical protein
MAKDRATRRSKADNMRRNDADRRVVRKKTWMAREGPRARS